MALGTRAGVVMDVDGEETAAPGIEKFPVSHGKSLLTVLPLFFFCTPFSLAALSLFDSFSVPVVTTSQINQVRVMRSQ